MAINKQYRSRGIAVGDPSKNHFQIRSEADCGNHCITVSFTIRGKQQPCKTAECGTFAEVVAMGEQLFYGFSQRNPWIYGDSSGRRAFVLLDRAPK